MILSKLQSLKIRKCLYQTLVPFRNFNGRKSRTRISNRYACNHQEFHFGQEREMTNQLYRYSLITSSEITYMFHLTSTHLYIQPYNNSFNSFEKVHGQKISCKRNFFLCEAQHLESAQICCV